MSATLTRRLCELLGQRQMVEQVCERLRPHAGKTVELRVGGIPLRAHICDDGLPVPDHEATPVDLTLDVPPGRLLRRAGGDLAAFSDLPFSGDAALAQALAALAADPCWEWRAAIEAALPMTIATPLADAAQSLFDAATALRQRADAGIADFLRHEASVAVGRDELEHFLADVDTLSEAVDRIEARLRLIDPR